ncbi:MAG: heavy metal-binding domain-containing protein [Sphingomonadaceae bacterium]
MILTTTPGVEGRPIAQYLGIASGEAVIGANIFRDLFAAVRDVVGGRSGAYERAFEEARSAAFAELAQSAQELGADAVVGITVDYESIGSGSMMMVTATGTAVKLG